MKVLRIAKGLHLGLASQAGTTETFLTWALSIGLVFFVL